MSLQATSLPRPPLTLSPAYRKRRGKDRAVCPVTNATCLSYERESVFSSCPCALLLSKVCELLVADEPYLAHFRTFDDRQHLVHAGVA